MRIVAVADVFGAGFEFMLSIGIEVSGRPPAEVGAQLAGLPEVLSVGGRVGSTTSKSSWGRATKRPSDASCRISSGG